MKKENDMDIKETIRNVEVQMVHMGQDIKRREEEIKKIKEDFEKLKNKIKYFRELYKV